MIQKQNFNFLKLHLLVIVYSLSTVFSKFAGQQDFLTFKFLLFTGLLFMSLGIYAFFWQKILSNFNLSVAYANRAADLLWGIIFGAVFFSEKITNFKILSVFFVFLGIFLVVSSDTKKEELYG